MLDATRTDTKESAGPSAFDLDSTHSAERTKNKNFWQEANRYAWFNPQFWIELLTHPSTDLEKVYKRRRARLYSLLACAFLIVSIVTNVLAYQDNRGTALVVTNLVVNFALLTSYLLSRTKYYLHAKNLGVMACWALPYAAVVIQLNMDDAKTSDNDISTTDSFNWLFTPAWMLMAAVFLSRESTIVLLIIDSFSVLLLPGITMASFYQLRKLLFFHMVNNLLLLLSTIIHFRDKLQLNQQQADAEGEGWERDPSTGQGPIARLLLQPHPEVVDRIFRRRSRVLSVVLLSLIPLTIIWSVAESLKWKDSTVDAALIAMSISLCIILVWLYALSRSKYTRWASRLTLFLFLIVPYFYLMAPNTTQEGQLYAALLATTAAAILGVTLLSGQELITLACVVFFTTIYSPMFPPHIVMSVCLLCAALAHRHDMQEIERTKPTEDVRQQRVVSDGTNLKIPFDKKYCGGYLSYSNYVRFQYAFTFVLAFVLGIVALVAIFNSDSVDSQLITVSIDESENSVNTNYQLYVTTFDCTSTTSQQYDVIGEKGSFHYINDEPLLSNSVTILNLQASGDVGLFTSVSMSLGNGNWVITNHDSCYIYKVEVWDVARNLGVTTQEDFISTTDDSSQAAPLIKQPPRDQPMGVGHGLSSAQFGALTWYGGIVRCPRADFDYTRTITNRVCDFNLVRGPLNWKKIWCPSPSSIDNSRSSELKCYSTQTPDYCNGHGTCNNGDCTCDPYFTDAKATKNGKVVVNNGFCQIPKAGACDSAATVDASSDKNQPTAVAKKMRYRSLDGACNYDTYQNADDGLAGMPIPRIMPANYSDDLATAPRQSNGKQLPAERDISNILFAQTTTVNNNTNSIPFLTQLFLGFFRFMYNDMVYITQTSSIEFIWPTAGDLSSKKLRFPITLNYLAETKNTGFAFKIKYCKDRVTIARQFDNAVTYWLDGSSIYGTDPDDEDFFREPAVTIQGKKKITSPSETGRIALDCFEGPRSLTSFTGDWSTCFPPTDNDDNYVIYDSRNMESPATFAFHVMFMREHNRLVDWIRRQATCSTVNYYYIPAFGLTTQPRDTTCKKNLATSTDYHAPNYGLWSGDDMYRLVRMLIGLEIQSVGEEMLRAIQGPDSFLFPNLPYRIDPNVRFNSGLTLESTLLFNLPTWQPAGFASREARLNQTRCQAPITVDGNDLSYLDGFPVTMNKYIQGGTEAPLCTNFNGVPDSNRGGADIISILVRRGREMGLPSFTDIREQIAANPSGCPWNSWNGVGKCDPALLFRAESLPGLKSLYNTPGDVELIVGSSLSIDYVPADFQNFYGAPPIDATQYYLIAGEVKRIIDLDIFGINHFDTGTDTFFARFRNDDPGSYADVSGFNLLGGLSFSEFTLRAAAAQSGQLLVQANTALKCATRLVFHQGGFNTIFTPNGYTNLFNIPYGTDPNVNPFPFVDCELPETFMDTANFPEFGVTYNQLICQSAGLSDHCWRPELPYCV